MVFRTWLAAIRHLLAPAKTRRPRSRFACRNAVVRMECLEDRAVFAADVQAEVAPAVTATTVFQASFISVAPFKVYEGQSSLVVKGRISAAGGPRTSLVGERVQITLNNLTKTALITSNGNFSATFSTKALKEANSPYEIKYHFAGNADYTAADSTAKLIVTQGPKTLLYWQQNPSDWPVDFLRLGGYRYSKDELVTLLKTAPGSDARSVLARQLIVAKLDIHLGLRSTDLTADVREAEHMLGGRGKIVLNSDSVLVKSTVGQAMVSLAGQLHDHLTQALS